eukprot:scaffold7349_cov173-Amphora_coffeaeformis.AAC.18
MERSSRLSFLYLKGSFRLLVQEVVVRPQDTPSVLLTTAVLSQRPCAGKEFVNHLPQRRSG